MIISFSGIDSAGKTTQVELLEKACREKRLKTKRVWSKARGTPGVCFLKELVRKDRHMDDSAKIEYRKDFFANPKKERLLYTVSLFDLFWYWGIYFRILGKKYDYLICDRYLWDTFIELTFDFKSIEIEKSVLWKILVKLAPVPIFSFVFVVPAEVSLSRDKQKDADGIESLELKLEKINMYYSLINDEKWTHVMDGTKTVEELHIEISKILKI